MSQWTEDAAVERCGSPVAESDRFEDEYDNYGSADEDDDNDWPDAFWNDATVIQPTVSHVETPERKLTTFYPSPPLGLKPQETRLLRLLPDEFDSDIRCSLSIQSLADGLSYEALSYAWGLRTSPNIISVNKHPMQVTDNLFSALRYLRRPDRARVLWVDAICMNQQSIEERNHQVNFMSEIYRTAAQVLVWLGEGSDVSEEPPRLYSPFSDPSTWTRQHRINRTFQEAVKVTHPSWWKRAWTVQEYVVAISTPVICFRGHVVSLDDAETVDRLREHDDSGFFTRIDELRGLARIYNSGGADLSEAIRLTADCRALDPRDKIYSVLGLLKSDQADLLKPDYAKSIAEVYALATKICLASQASFALFPVPRLAGSLLIKAWTLVWEHPSAYGPPSWSMNYAKDNIRSRYTPAQLEDAASYANVSVHGSQPDIEYCPSISTSHRVLHCRVYFVGRVGEATENDGKVYPAAFVRSLATKMSDLFDEVAVGKSAMAALHDDFARRFHPVMQDEWSYVKITVREGFKQDAYPYHLVKIGQMLDWALDIKTDVRRTLYQSFVWYMEDCKTLGGSGAMFLGNAMRRRLVEHCFDGWQDEDCIKWLQFRDMGAAKEEGNGSLFCTEQLQFGIAEAVVEKGDIVAVLMPDSKSILLKPGTCKDGITRYQYKGFVYLPAIKQFNVEKIALEEIELL